MVDHPGVGFLRLFSFSIAMVVWEQRRRSIQLLSRRSLPSGCLSSPSLDRTSTRCGGLVSSGFVTGAVCVSLLLWNGVIVRRTQQRHAQKTAGEAVWAVARNWKAG